MTNMKIMVILGTIGSIIDGATFPIFSIFLSYMITTMLKLYQDPNNRSEQDNVDFYSLIFFIIAVV